MSIGEIPLEESVIDAIPVGDPSAVLPPVPAQGGLTPEQLAAATTVPPNPTGDLVDQALAANPLPTTPLAPVPTTPIEVAAGNVKKVDELNAEQIKNTEEKTKLETQIAEKSAEFKAHHEKELIAINDRQELHRQAAEQTVTEARNKAESEPYHSYWESRTNGQKALIAVGLILNGVSWNPQHVNRGVQMLQDAMANDLELQKQKHADLWKAVNEAQQGVKDLDSSQLRELSAFSANEGARWDAIAGRLGAAAAANKGKGDIATIKKQAIEASEKANTAWQNSITAAAQAKHFEEIDKERARHDLENEKLRAKKIGAGGGGSGGGGKLQENAVKLREEIETAKAANKPLTGAQIDRRALELKIPPVAKAGRISLKTIMDEVGKEAHGEAVDLSHSDKDETRLVRVNGEVLGKSNTAKAATAFALKDVQYGDAARRVKELAEDIRQYGELVTKPEDVQRRAAKYANAIIGVAVVSPLGKTNEAIHQEAQSIGLPGTVDPSNLKESIAKLLTGYHARGEIVNHKVMEMNRIRSENRGTLTPLTDAEKAKYAKGGVTSNADHPDRELRGGGIAQWNAARGGYEKVE